ncbi:MULTISPECIES: NDP-hexose 2,3-dehydratase family protein [unclassified Crossiella]|uniref:NDP-hexose 2,3-dehydratase family protein n=1 Tax=unclassified Crossiella TaxID=2620835 RepID=UPI001FFEF605|nr:MULTISPECIES: NDP-hexose 2,3-dehydratase family protein [unclassified Crossiella]MCK2241324.1 NDP-hexose 2,3-dehydratase family protein [Crossiella sp. S99.2]MCK2253532.1 NDP-hexose 2,3-dehydratase family protein [Crossiella sp. S99.1]
MTTYSRTALPIGTALTDEPAELIARSVLARSGRIAELEHFHRWMADEKRRSHMDVRAVPLQSLSGWRVDGQTGNIGHDSGKFFSIEGLDVVVPGGPVTWWQQPIINQPEVGILGILVTRFAGVLHCLMQAKIEPGNCNGLQLSPTVQATRSNYTRVHQGSAVPYLEYFRDTEGHRVLADVRQSEQGSWFHRKRNRNMVVEVTEEVELLEGFCWLTLGQLHQLLAVDDLVNMDARTVLSCMPFAGRDLLPLFEDVRTEFTAALIRSYSVESATRHSMAEVLSWITEVRSQQLCQVELIPLREVSDWRQEDGRIRHDSGLFFNVIGVSVTAAGREVRAWSQPMIEPCDEGVVAFLAKRIDGVLHLLAQAKTEPGYVDVIELAPTVQCSVSNYDALPPQARPPFLDTVLAADYQQIRFDAVHSEEGGRFFHARNRYLVVEVAEDFEPEHPGYRWLTLAQLVDLLRHSNYINMQARSLIACLHGLSG